MPTTANNWYVEARFTFTAIVSASFYTGLSVMCIPFGDYTLKVGYAGPGTFQTAPLPSAAFYPVTGRGTQASAPPFGQWSTSVPAGSSSKVLRIQAVNDALYLYIDGVQQVPGVALFSDANKFADLAGMTVIDSPYLESAMSGSSGGSLEISNFNIGTAQSAFWKNHIRTREDLVNTTTLPPLAGGGSSSIFFNDTFTGVAGTLLTAHTADVGGGWTTTGTAAPLLSGATGVLQAQATAFAYNFAFSSAVPPSNFYKAMMTYTRLLTSNGPVTGSLTDAIGLFCNSTFNGSGYYFGYDNGSHVWRLARRFFGSITLLSSSAVNVPAVGETRYVMITSTDVGSGNVRIDGWVNGVILLTVTESTSVMSEPGTVGLLTLGSPSANGSIDDVVGKV